MDAARFSGGEQLELDKHRLKIIDDIFTLKCPRCKMAFLDYDNCAWALPGLIIDYCETTAPAPWIPSSSMSKGSAISCSACKCGFCSFCLEDACQLAACSLKPQRLTSVCQATCLRTVQMQDCGKDAHSHFYKNGSKCPNEGRDGADDVAQSPVSPLQYQCPLGSATKP